jgi:hypothetical protein
LLHKNNAIEDLTLRIGASQAAQAAILRTAASRGSKLSRLDLLGNNRSISPGPVAEALRARHNQLKSLGVRLRDMHAQASSELGDGLKHANARKLRMLHIQLTGTTEGSDFGREMADALVHLHPADEGQPVPTVNNLRELSIGGPADADQASAMVTSLAAALRDPNCGLRKLTLHGVTPSIESLTALIRAATTHGCRLKVLDLKPLSRNAVPGLSDLLDQAAQARPGLQILTN